MEESVSLATFESAYEDRSAVWVIGEPQPAIVELERAGGIGGAVFDPGCGSGEHTIHLAKLGYDVRGADFSARAIEQAQANAAERQVAADFAVADALNLGGEPRFDTVVDSALFHVFGPEDQARYAENLHRVCHPGARAYVLALAPAEDEPGLGPRISDTMIRDAFTDGWVLEDISASRYRVIVSMAEDAAQLGVRVGECADAAAWLARARRI